MDVTAETELTTYSLDCWICWCLQQAKCLKTSAERA